MRAGEDVTLGEDHTMATVYTEMFLEVCRAYPGLPDARSLANSDIRFFYEAIRTELRTISRGKG